MRFKRGINVSGFLTETTVKGMSEYADHIRKSESNVFAADILLRNCEKYGMGLVLYNAGAESGNVKFWESAAKKFTAERSIAFELPDAETAAAVRGLTELQLAVRCAEGLQGVKKLKLPAGTAVSFDFFEPEIFTKQTDITVFYPDKTAAYNEIAKQTDAPVTPNVFSDVGFKSLDSFFRVHTFMVKNSLYCGSYGACSGAPPSSAKNYHLDIYKIFEKYGISRAIAENTADFPEKFRLL